MRKTFLAVVVAGLAVTAPAATAATTSGTIDFESVSAPQSPTGEGLIVDTLASGSGISGGPFAGSVGVFGFSPHPSHVGDNTALIFDATCTVDEANGVPEDCSGEDSDLFLPQLGNVLIVAENLRDANANGRIDEPDDSDLWGTRLELDFSAFEDGLVDVKSIDVADTDDDEDDGVVRAYRNGALVASVPIPLIGDNAVSTLPVNAVDVDALEVVLSGSAAIDNIELEVRAEDTGAQGCTPGFWKNHVSAWEGYSASQKFNAVFGVAYDPYLTLLGALKLGGGGYAALARHATAALLNAAHDDVDYGLTSSEIVARVQNAFATGNPEPLKDRLDELNNAGCSVDKD